MKTTEKIETLKNISWNNWKINRISAEIVEKKNKGISAETIKKKKKRKNISWNCRNKRISAELIENKRILVEIIEWKCSAENEKFSAQKM